MSPPDASYRLALPLAGVAPDEVPALLAAEAYSVERIARARDVLAGLPEDRAPGMGTVALGSLGRMEASPSSDLDLAFFFDPNVTTRLHAEAVRSIVIEALREGFDIPEKTFRRPVDMEELLTNVGGRRDSNERLTYRALVLTEGVWLHNAEVVDAVKRAVFQVYASGRVTRGRFLASLGNDLHRYYRTVCVDYRHKVEEQAKSWSIRSLKLRHSRKLWHLANIALQLWATYVLEEDEERDARLFERMDWPSLVRLTHCLHDFDAAETARPLVLAYERFLERLSEPEVRAELDELEYGTRHESRVYTELRSNADRIDAAAEEVVDVLWRHCRPHLVRFCLL